MIKTGFCVSYDWEFLKNSLPRVYESSDVICLAIDKNRRSWSGEKYDIEDDKFYAFVESIDKDKKIILYEDDFSLSSLDSRGNCNRQRMMIANRLGIGGWHVQVDSDEYFLDFKGFTEYLIQLNPNPSGAEKPFNVLANWIPLIKKLDEGFLMVDFGGELPEMAPFATTCPNYERARHNGYFNRLSPFYVLHETWARGEAELWYKINNWGHASEELSAQEQKMSYFEWWKSLNVSNYQMAQNVHPANPPEWPALTLEKGANIDELIDHMKAPIFPLSSFRLAVRNNRNIARIMHWIKWLF